MNNVVLFRLLLNRVLPAVPAWHRGHPELKQTAPWVGSDATTRKWFFPIPEKPIPTVRFPDLIHRSERRDCHRSVRFEKSWFDRRRKNTLHLLDDLDT